MGLLHWILPKREDARLMDLQESYDLGMGSGVTSANMIWKSVCDGLRERHDELRERYNRKVQKHHNTEQTLRATRKRLKDAVAFWKRRRDEAYHIGHADGLARARAEYSTELRRAVEQGVKLGTDRAVVLLRSAPELAHLSVNAQTAIEAIAVRIAS